MNGDHSPESGPQGGTPAPPQPPASGSRNTILLIVGGIMALAILDIGLKSGSGSKSGGTSAVAKASLPAADKASSQVDAEQRLREAVQKATLEAKKAQKAAAAAQQQLNVSRADCERMRELGYIGGDCDELVGGKKAARKAAKAAKRGYRPKAVDTKMTTLGKFTINLRDSAVTQRILRLEVQVESALETAVKVEERMPQLRDSVILLASDYSYSELEGIDGKLRLRDEIQARLSAVLAPETVERVYFTAFVVQ